MTITCELRYAYLTRKREKMQETMKNTIQYKVFKAGCQRRILV